MAIEWKKEWVDVGFVKSRDDMRQTYKVCLEAEEENKYVTWTDEFLESSEDFEILEDKFGDERVYKKTTVGPFCEDCGMEAFHDQYNQEYYCPNCES